MRIFSFFILCFTLSSLSSSAQPDRAWATYFGGGTPVGTHLLNLAYDSSGFLYIGGLQFDSTVHIATSGSFKPEMDSNGEGFLAKFDTLGNRIWATYLGNGGFSYVSNITADLNGNVIAVGNTLGTLNNIGTAGTYRPDFPPNHSLSNSSSDFVIKFDANGQRIWGTYIGFTADNSRLPIRDITTDSAGNIYICGASALTSMQFPSGTFMPDPPIGLNTGFLIKLSSSGNFIWGTYYSGNQESHFNYLACDSESNVYVVGRTRSDVDITTPGAMYPNPNNTSVNSFVAKFNPTGNRVWATYSNGIDLLGGIAVAPDNGFYLLGFTDRDTGIATSGAYQEQYADSVDISLSRWTKDGQKLWGTYYGGHGRESASGTILIPNISMFFDPVSSGTNSNITLDNENNIIIAGKTNSEDQIKVGCTYGSTEGKQPEGFMAKFYPDGQIMWGSYFDVPVHGVVSGHQDKSFYLLSNTNLENLNSPGAFQDTISGVITADLPHRRNTTYEAPRTKHCGLTTPDKVCGYKMLRSYGSACVYHSRRCSTDEAPQTKHRGLTTPDKVCGYKMLRPYGSACRYHGRHFRAVGSVCFVGLEFIPTNKASSQI